MRVFGTGAIHPNMMWKIEKPKSLSRHKLDSNNSYCPIALALLKRLPFLRYVYDKCILQRRLPNQELILSWDGQRIMVRNPRHSLIGRELFLNGTWEPEVTNYICPKITQGMTVLDVGADIGYYTLLFAKRVGKDGRVVAFEPIPAAREKLEHNVRLNGYTNVTICDFALFSSNGQGILEGPFQLSRINPAKTTSEKQDIQIQTRVFDECVSKLQVQRIDLVKIDVEGAELDVLRGMEQSLENYHPILLIEVHPKHLSHFNYGPEDLLRLLEALNYRVHPVDKTSLDFRNGNVTICCT